MKKILLIAAFIISSFTYGQVSVAKALKLVAITTAQRDALTINTNEHPVIYNFTTGDFERYNGTTWESWGAGGGGSPTWGFISGTLSDQTDLQAALDLKAALAGGTFTGDISVPTEAYGISWDGSNEAATKDALYDKIEAVVSGGGAASLTDLSDVNTATVTSGNVLVADGVDFESRALVEADISDLSHTANTDAQDLTLTGNTLAVTGDPNTDVDLSPYLDNTDTQDLTLSVNTLSLVNGGNVDLSGYLDNTDTQLTQEQVEDFAGGLVSSGSDGLSYDDGTGAMSVVDAELTITEAQISDLNHVGALEVDSLSVALTTAVTKLDFLGDGVTITEPATDEIDVTINDGTADTSPTSGILQWMGTKAQLYSEFGNPVSGIPSNYVLYVTDSTVTTTAADIVNVPSGNLIATDVQAALDELQTELDGAGGGSESTTVSDTGEIDLTLTTFDITADIVSASIDETKLDVSTNASLDLADSALQSLNGVVTGNITDGTIDVLDLDAALQTSVGLADTSVQMDADNTLTALSDWSIKNSSAEGLSISDAGSSILRSPFVTIQGWSSVVTTGPQMTFGTSSLAMTNWSVADQNSGAAGSIVTKDWVETGTSTLTNKTIDANGTGNAISNIDVADLANGTDGELITWSATGTPATVAVGTANQVLTSNGVGAAPTFQDASGGGTVESVTITVSDPNFTGSSNVDNTLLAAQGAGTIIQLIGVAVRTESYTSATSNTTWSIVYSGDGGAISSGVASIAGTNVNAISHGDVDGERYADYANTALTFRLTNATSQTTTGDIKVNLIYYVWTY